MTTWRARIAVIAVFVAGFVSGAAVLNLYRLRVENQIAHSQDVMIQVALYRMERDLDLTPEQKEQVRQALLGARAEVLGKTREFIPAFRDIFERTQSRIREILTPEQREKFDRIVSERRAFMRRVEESGGQPPKQ